MSPRSKEKFQEIRKASKEKILNSALRLFSTKGFFNTSIREIAKEADISPGLFYNYFESKEELASNVLKNAFNSIEAAINNQKQMNPQENFGLAISNFFSLIETKQDQIRLLAQMGLHKNKLEAINKLTSTRYEESVSRFQYLLKEIGVENSKIEARFLVAALDGIVFETLLMSNPIDVKEIKKNIINKYCRS